MLKQTKNLTGSIFSSRRSLALTVGACMAMAGMAFVSPAARADTYDEQIRNLQQKNSQNQQALNVLGAQAANFQDVIAKLQAQVSALQSQITSNENQQAELQRQIIQKQAEIDRQREILASAVKAMYIDDQMTTIEMLATSKNMSDYVDKAAYRNTVQNQVRKLMAEITVLQSQMKEQKETVEKLLVDQKEQRSQLAASRAEQSRLLSLNQSQQADFNNTIKANNAQMLEIRRKQAAELARLFAANGGTLKRGSACGGTYPTKWCAVAQDSRFDDWGFYNRQCVSYVAWKVYEATGFMPHWGGKYHSGYFGGNASAWANNARRDGYRVDNNPNGEVVAAVTRDAGSISEARNSPGHVMFVDSVNPNGTINISQYNANATGPNWDNDGNFSQRYGMSTSGLKFIHFR